MEIEWTLQETETVGNAMNDAVPRSKDRLVRSSILQLSRSAETRTRLRGPHGRQKMNIRAQAEERMTGLKNNMSCVLPAPIQHFTIT